jgi:hypothetical protein
LSIQDCPAADSENVTHFTPEKKMMRKDGTFRGRAVATAFAALLGAIACTDSASGPAKETVSRPIFDLVVGNPTAVPVGHLQVCKVAAGGGAAGVNFTFTVTKNGSPVAGSPFTIATGACADVGTSASAGNLVDEFVITEGAGPANWTLTSITATRYQPVPGPVNTGSDAVSLANRRATISINQDLGGRVTFTNTFTPPTGCTFTKGYYRNHPAAVTAQDGRTLQQTRDILAATPGQPGGVTWGDDNLLLNLYQQLLTALINLNGANGPAAVHTAVLAAQAGTDGSLWDITTTLTHEQMADLVDTLSDFNEGSFTGWPHCPD